MHKLYIHADKLTQIIVCYVGVFTAVVPVDMCFSLGHLNLPLPNPNLSPKPGQEGSTDIILIGIKHCLQKEQAPTQTVTANNACLCCPLFHKRSTETSLVRTVLHHACARCNVTLACFTRQSTNGQVSLGSFISPDVVTIYCNSVKREK